MNPEYQIFRAWRTIGPWRPARKSVNRAVSEEMEAILKPKSDQETARASKKRNRLDQDADVVCCPASCSLVQGVPAPSAGWSRMVPTSGEGGHTPPLRLVRFS